MIKLFVGEITHYFKTIGPLPSFLSPLCLAAFGLCGLTSQAHSERYSVLRLLSGLFRLSTRSS